MKTWSRLPAISVSLIQFGESVHVQLIEVVWFGRSMICGARSVPPRNALGE